MCECLLPREVERGGGGGTRAATAAGSTKPFLSSQRAGCPNSSLRTRVRKFDNV